METNLALESLAPDSTEEWRRMLRFVGWTSQEAQAAARSAEALFQRGHELVVSTYDYLRQVPETAAILGWEKSIDAAHLEERRRFFTIWLARTLGLDTSDEFAEYLFRAGKYHAGHGPRQIHTPAIYVTGSMGLVEARFARFMAEAGLSAEVLAGAMAAWSKYLAVQLHQMLFGYRVALDLQGGAITVPCTVYGRLRPVIGTPTVEVHTEPGASVADVLRKFFNYYPQARGEALDRVWRSTEKDSDLWVEVTPAYTPREGWRVLLNGRDVKYAEGFASAVQDGDTVSLFPPGR